MKPLKKIATSLLLVAAATSTLSATFEQSGVKEGNTRVSVSLFSIVPDSGDPTVTLNGEIGRYITDDIEASINTLLLTGNGSTTYYVRPGVNYYFLKTPTLTPYVGTQVYYFGNTSGGDGTFGNNYHLGAHKFFTENFAVTAEAGTDFIEFTDYSHFYTNVSLTYFFD